MTPLEEILAWTDTQIESEISRQIPDDLDFVCEWRDGLWSARIESAPTGRLSHVLHEAEHVDRRMALYAVYGHLWLAANAGTGSSARWDPTVPRPTRVSVSQFVQSKLADPADLDPSEIAAVYGVPRSKRRDVD